MIAEIADDLANEIIQRVRPLFAPRQDQLQYTTDQVHKRLTIHFRFRNRPLDIRIWKVAECFEQVEYIDWIGKIGAEHDKPRITFDGTIKGKLVQLIFVLENGDG